MCHCTFSTVIILTFFLCLGFSFLAQSCSQANLLAWLCVLSVFTKLHLDHYIFTLQLQTAKCRFQFSSYNTNQF